MTGQTEQTGGQMTGAKMVVQALRDQGVDTVFGYPGGAVLPIYDELFQQNDIRHVLVRHEQGAIHAAEGYARSTGKPGVAIVTSGPGATNAVTGLTDALLDSIPIVVLFFSYLFSVCALLGMLTRSTIAALLCSIRMNVSRWSGGCPLTGAAVMSGTARRSRAPPSPT